MKKPKPIGFVVSATGISPGHWCVAQQPDNLLMLINSVGEKLRTIRTGLSTAPIDVSPDELPTDHRGRRLRLCIRLDSLEPVPLGEYIDADGREVPAASSPDERFYPFVIEVYLGGPDRKKPFLTLRLYLHPDEQQMGPFYLDDRGRLYREAEYAAYDKSNNPLPEEMQAFFAGARGEVDALTAKSMDGAFERLLGVLDRLEGAPPPQTSKPN